MKSTHLILRAALSVSILVLGVFTPFTLSNEQSEHDEHPPNTHWNELIFTQQWSYAACLQFKKEVGESHKCRYEGKPSLWSIHGIWPTQIGTKGPSFCKKVKFDESLLSPILPQLKDAWYEISAAKDFDWFWEHEWTKHGSCAEQLPELDDELKYFEHGLSLRNEYDIYTVLKNKAIIPQDTAGYTFAQISTAIEKTLKVTPRFQCLQHKDGEKEEFHLLTVELCFSRDLKLISCANHEPGWLQGGLQCPTNKPIMYYDNFAKRAKTEF